MLVKIKNYLCKKSFIMKNIKFILFLFLSITILSCSDNDNSVPAFALSNANIAGTYNMSSFNIDIKAEEDQISS